MFARITHGNRVEPMSLPLLIPPDAGLPSRRYQLRRMPDVDCVPGVPIHPRLYISRMVVFYAY